MIPPLLWFLRYLFLALQCPIPIVEAIWITSDRLAFESERLLPRIKYQLLSWDYNKDNGSWFRFYRGRQALCLMSPLKFNLVAHLLLDTATTFGVSISYPTNIYYVEESPGISQLVFSSRREWLSSLLNLLAGINHVRPAILDFTDTKPRQLWLPLRHGSEWIEIQ